MECKKIQQSLASYYYRELDIPVMSEIARHLETCPMCRTAYIEKRKTLILFSKEELEQEKSSAFWQDFQYQVYQKLEAEKTAGAWWRSLLIPRRLVPALAGAIALLFIIISSTRLGRREPEIIPADLQIVQELELMENYELIQDLDLLENFSEAEQLKG